MSDLGLEHLELARQACDFARDAERNAKEASEQRRPYEDRVALLWAGIARASALAAEAEAEVIESDLGLKDTDTARSAWAVAKAADIHARGAMRAARSEGNREGQHGQS